MHRPIRGDRSPREPSHITIQEAGSDGQWPTRSVSWTIGFASIVLAVGASMIVGAALTLAVGLVALAAALLAIVAGFFTLTGGVVMLQSSVNALEAARINLETAVIERTNAEIKAQRTTTRTVTNALENEEEVKSR